MFVAFVAYVAIVELFPSAVDPTRNACFVVSYVSRRDVVDLSSASITHPSEDGVKVFLLTTAGATGSSGCVSNAWLGWAGPGRAILTFVLALSLVSEHHSDIDVSSFPCLMSVADWTAAEGKHSGDVRYRACGGIRVQVLLC